ncbi:MAG: hypothetical protein ACREPT_05360 [Rudaea sp.]
MIDVRAAAGRVRAAQAELDLAHVALGRELAPVLVSFNRHRVAWMVAGGLVGGLTLSWLPSRLSARIGATVGSSVALLARSVIGRMIAAAVLASPGARKAAPMSPASD